jgi:hypothetical protein
MQNMATSSTPRTGKALDPKVSLLVISVTVIHILRVLQFTMSEVFVVNR